MTGRLRRLPRLITRAARLAPRDVLTTTRVAMLFAAAELSVRTKPLAWSAARFGVSLDATADPPTAPEQIVLTEAERRGARAVHRLSPRLYGSERGCLRRSLVIGHLLRRHDPVMRIGVRRDPVAGFGAHAWIEIAGRPIEQGVESYLPFDFGGAVAP